MSSPDTVFGMSLATFTLIHVLISLTGIGSGFVVLFGLVAGKRLEGWTALFLATTVATSVTGFGFPFDHLLPSHRVGFISLVVLAVGIAARYAFHLRGAWRHVYVVCAAGALPECLRGGGAGVPEDSRPQSARPEADGAAVRRLPGDRPRVVRRPRDRRRDSVPCGEGATAAFTREMMRRQSHRQGGTWTSKERAPTSEASQRSRGPCGTSARTA
jgi:hypothetical protein